MFGYNPKTQINVPMGWFCCSINAVSADSMAHLRATSWPVLMEQLSIYVLFDVNYTTVFKRGTYSPFSVLLKHCSVGFNHSFDWLAGRHEMPSLSPDCFANVTALTANRSKLISEMGLRVHFFLTNSIGPNGFPIAEMNPCRLITADKPICWVQKYSIRHYCPTNGRYTDAALGMKP